jgi:hypothetical protein
MPSSVWPAEPSSRPRRRSSPTGARTRRRVRRCGDGSPRPNGPARGRSGRSPARYRRCRRSTAPICPRAPLGQAAVASNPGGWRPVAPDRGSCHRPGGYVVLVMTAAPARGRSATPLECTWSRSRSPGSAAGHHWCCCTPWGPHAESGSPSSLRCRSTSTSWRWISRDSGTPPHCRRRGNRVRRSWRPPSLDFWTTSASAPHTWSATRWAAGWRWSSPNSVRRRQ